MKRIFLIFILFVVSIDYGTAISGRTIIYVVRHAEKDLSDPKNTDPDLSEEGYSRAEALSEKLKAQNIGVIFSTNYKRTKQTALPLAKNKGLEILSYQGRNYAELKETVNKNYKNQKVLIVGHSNTVLEIIKVFGAVPPVSSLTEEDYDFLFEIRTDHLSKVKLITRRYGKEHHSTHLK